MSNSMFKIQLTTLRTRETERLARPDSRVRNWKSQNPNCNHPPRFFNLQFFLTVCVIIKYIRITKLLFSFSKLYIYWWLATICYYSERISVNSIPTIFLNWLCAITYWFNINIYFFMKSFIKKLNNIKCYS